MIADNSPFDRAYIISEPRKWPKQKARDKLAKQRLAAANKAMEEYRNAYAKVYGTAPTIRLDGVYFRIVGNSQGVTIKRLHAMTKQLQYRRP
jgi:hypothetical protein